MNEIKNAQRRLETAFGIKEGKSGIDRAYEDEKYKGVIRGFAVMTQGNVKDMRGWQIDETTLQQIVDVGNKSQLGLKSRFGHPNMSSSALGTFTGRAKNFRKDGDIARADLFISKTAYETPDGDIASYVLDLAEKDPDAFGTSVVLGEFDLEYADEKKDKSGKDLPPKLRVSSLMAVDVVDDPAANDGMFNKHFNSSVELSAKATEFMNKLLDNPDALEYVVSFLERYRVNRVDINKQETVLTERKQVMNESTELTVEVLKKDHPEMVSSLQNEAVKDERVRCSTIVKTANKEFAGMGMDSIVEESIDNGKTVDASLAAMRGKRLEDLKQNANKVPGADQEETPQKKNHLETAREYQKEHKCSIQEALSQTAESRQK
ncbi:MAG: hypothetical protein Q7K71_05430 [Candidatus Omnitrophota bacterium]|nr:hypothetical protein [Candidatus Omnitrophota bacterium]